MYPTDLSQPVNTPDGLSKAMNAKANGTPAKFDATPQKVIKLVRMKGGSPPRMAEYASRKPNIPPPIEVTRLILMLIQYAFTRLGFCKRCTKLLNVNAPVFVFSKLLIAIVEEG